MCCIHNDAISARPESQSIEPFKKFSISMENLQNRNTKKRHITNQGLE